MTFAWLATHWWAAIFACLILPAAGTVIVVALVVIACGGDVCRWIRGKFTRWNTAPDALAAQLKRPDEPFDSMISVACEACVPWGHGPGKCTCTADCRHGDCQGGDCTTISGAFTPRDIAWLKSLPTGPVPRPRVVWYRRRHQAGKKVTR